MRYVWLAPLTGVAFLVVVIIGFIVAGEPPDADQPVQEIVSHYVDNKDSVQAGAFLSTIAAALLLFFAGYLRKVLRAAPGETGTLPAVALAGATVLVTAAGIDAMITFTLAETADNIEPAAVQALQALWDNDFMPFIIGTGVFLLASGIAIVRHGALPRWLGWIAVVLGVVSLTPIGFVGFLGGAVWILVVSVLLTLRARSPVPSQPTLTGSA